MDTIDYNDLFEYRDGKLFNKVFRQNNARKGDRAGSLAPSGYRLVWIGKPKREHRVIWEMHNGKIAKGLQIDHINRIKDDNRIENLRVVTGSVNRHNNNAVGVKIDKRAKSRHGTDHYIAQIKNKQKHIHIGYYGTFCGAKMARMMYKLKLITLA